MKFKANEHYDLFGCDVVFIEDHKLGSPVFRIPKEVFGFNIDIVVDQNFLKNMDKNMDSTEMRKLERLFRELENYAKFNAIEKQEDKE